MLCFEVKEASEILLVMCIICTQSLQARRIWFASSPTAACCLRVFFIAISTCCCSNGIMRYSDPESIFIHSRLFYFLENTKKMERLQQIQQAFLLWNKEQAIKDHFKHSPRLLSRENGRIACILTYNSHLYDSFYEILRFYGLFLVLCHYICTYRSPSCII